MDDDRVRELEVRVAELERRVEELEADYAAEETRARRARALNVWLRIGVYVTALALMLLFLLLARAGSWF